VERDGPIVWLRMNRPEAHNAFSRDMMAMMADRVHQLDQDRDTRVAILCGNGPSFSTGLDVKELARGELDVVTFFIAWNRMMRSLRALSIPLIVAIQPSRATTDWRVTICISALAPSATGSFPVPHLRCSRGSSAPRVRGDFACSPNTSTPRKP
jgi:Enoyl-CoA hydratase/isomerase